MQSMKLVAVAAMSLLALAACSSSSTAPSAAGNPTAAASTAAGASSAPPSGAATPAAPAGSVNMCGLLSPSDLKTATGSDYGAGEDDGYGSCVWRVGGAKANNGKGQVIAELQTAQLSFIKSSFTPGNDVTVSGHPGYWHHGQFGSLWVDTGGRLLVLSFDPVGPETPAVAQKLAEIAVARM